MISNNVSQPWAETNENNSDLHLIHSPTSSTQVRKISAAVASLPTLGLFESRNQLPDTNNRAVSIFTQPSLPNPILQPSKNRMDFVSEHLRNPIGCEERTKYVEAMQEACRKGDKTTLYVLFKQAKNLVLMEFFLDHSPLLLMPDKDLSQAHVECIYLMIKYHPHGLLWKDDYCKNLLHLFAERGLIDHLQVCLNDTVIEASMIHRALQAQSVSGFVPLHSAVVNQKTECVRCLIKKFPEAILLPDKHQYTPVHYAALIGCTEILVDMLQYAQGIQALHSRDESGNVPLHLAAQYQKYECEKIIAQTSPETLTFLNLYHNTPIHCAADHDHSDSLQFMLSLLHDDSILKRQNISKQTPLHIATKFRKSDCIRLLMQQNPKAVLLQDNEHNTPVHIASRDLDDIAIKIFLADEITELALIMRGAGNLTPLQQAILRNEDAIPIICSILERYPEYLYYENCGYLPLQWAAYNRCEKLVEFFAVHFPHALYQRSQQTGDTVLSVAASTGQASLIKLILGYEGGKSLLHIKNYSGDYPLHLAACLQDMECTEILMQASTAMIIHLNKNCETPFHIAVRNNHLKKAEFIIKHSSIMEEIANPSLFSNLYSPYASSRRFLDKCRKMVQQPFIPVKTVTFTGKKATADDSPRALFRSWTSTNRDLKNEYHRLHDSVCKKIDVDIPLRNIWMHRDIVGETVRKMRSMGVYIAVNCFEPEMKGNTYTLGDENSSVQLINFLINLGVQSIEAVISPNVDSQSDYQLAQKTAVNKLTFLFSGLNPENPFPQSVMIKACKVTFHTAKNYHFGSSCYLAFCHGPEVYRATGSLPENMLTLKPFNFAKFTETQITDCANGKCNAITLDLPANSIIPENNIDFHSVINLSAVQPKECRTLEELSMARWMREQFDQCARTSKKTGLAKSMVDLCMRASNDSIKLGILYGSAQLNSAESKENILRRWVQGVQVLAQNQYSQHPIYIVANTNSYNAKLLADMAHLMTCTFINLDEEKSDQTIRKLNAGNIAICAAPYFPKEIFKHALLCSNLPALIEGANTTTWELQNGKPYCSVMPYGRTPIPQDMGDPLEALKHKAFSVKLDISDYEYSTLQGLHNLIRARLYEHALYNLNTIIGEDSNCIKLRFLWQKSITSGPKDLVFNFASLLKGAANRPPSNRVNNVLLSTSRPPSGEAIADYIYECMNEDSLAFRHFKLMQLHVNLPPNNTPYAALKEWCINKKLIKDSN